MPAALSTDEYWASLPPDDCTAQVFAKRDQYRNAVKSSMYYPRWVHAVRAYHGLADSQSGDSSMLGRRGSKGQRAVVRVSRTATDARHVLSITSQAVPALDELPSDDSGTTLSQVKLGTQLQRYYMERRQLGRCYYAAAEGSLKFGIYWVVFDWDPFAGEPLPSPNPVTGRSTTGDVIYRARGPLHVVVDMYQGGEHDWMIVRDPISRWELLARYPGQADKIKSLPSLIEDEKWCSDDFRLDTSTAKSDTDQVALYTLYHRKTRALPEGRLLCAPAPDLWLFDGALPYDELPVADVNGGRIDGSAFADSPMFHSTGLQAALDRTASAWVTNVLATGHQLVSITDPKFEVAELSDGVSAIVNKPNQPGGEPRGIDLTVPQTERANLVNYLQSAIDGTFATNPTLRGEPDANVRSGAFAGLMIQRAIEYNNPLQYSFQRAVERGGNHLIAILKRFADEPIVAEIAGPGGQWRRKKFSQQDLSGIHRLYAKSANPAMQTAAFRKSIADELLERGLIKTASEYFAILQTNDPDIATDDGETEVINILQENEAILAGQPHRALETDNHQLHIRKHAALLDAPDARANEGLVNAVAQAVQEHVQMLVTQPPALAAALGRPPPPPPPMPPPGPPGPPHPAAGGKKPPLPPPEATPPLGPVGP